MSVVTFASPALSPSFDRARKLSRVMAVLFTIGFWITLVGLVVVLVIPFLPGDLPEGGKLQLNSIAVTLTGLSLWQRLGAVLALVISALPLVFLMHHTRHVFAHFSKGKVFSPEPVAHIRQAGIWMIILFFAEIVAPIAIIAIGAMPPGQFPLAFWPLFIGITTTIAAHVMAEASRIAADHAEIV
jgi:hypothetical protein